MLTISCIYFTVSVTPRQVAAIPKNSLPIISSTELITTVIPLTSEGDPILLYNFISSRLVSEGDNELGRGEIYGRFLGSGKSLDPPGGLLISVFDFIYV